IHALDCWASPRGGLACTGHSGSWHLTVLPLLYRRTPLGFLLLDKPYDGALAFGSEMFFLQTIQTILGEEVANAVHMSRLTDLKNFNAAVLDNVESGVLTANERGEITFANRRARLTLGVAAEAESLPPLSFDTLFGRRVADAAPPAERAGAGLATGGFTGELCRTDGGPTSG